MSDPLKALAAVNFLRTQFASDQLNSLADQQESSIRQSEDIRRVQEFADQIQSDDQITESEHNQLMNMMERIGLNPDRTAPTNGATDGALQRNGEWDSDERVNLEVNDAQGTDANEAADARDHYEGYSSMIDNAAESAEDDQGKLELNIQMATQEYTSGANAASTFEKRVADLKSQLANRLDA
jgi:hypothetical protein